MRGSFSISNSAACDQQQQQLAVLSATVSDVLRVAPALQQQHCNFNDVLLTAAVHHQPVAHLLVNISLSFSNFSGFDMQQQLALQHSVSSPAAVSLAFATANSATSTCNFRDTPPQPQCYCSNSTSSSALASASTTASARQHCQRQRTSAAACALSDSAIQLQISQHQRHRKISDIGDVMHCWRRAAAARRRHRRQSPQISGGSFYWRLHGGSSRFISRLRCSNCSST